MALLNNTTRNNLLGRKLVDFVGTIRIIMSIVDNLIQLLTGNTDGETLTDDLDVVVPEPDVLDVSCYKLLGTLASGVRILHDTVSQSHDLEVFIQFPVGVVTAIVIVGGGDIINEDITDNIKIGWNGGSPVIAINTGTSEGDGTTEVFAETTDLAPLFDGEMHKVRYTRNGQDAMLWVDDVLYLDATFPEAARQTTINEIGRCTFGAEYYHVGKVGRITLDGAVFSMEDGITEGDVVRNHNPSSILTGSLAGDWEVAYADGIPSETLRLGCVNSMRKSPNSGYISPITTIPASQGAYIEVYGTFGFGAPDGEPNGLMGFQEITTTPWPITASDQGGVKSISCPGGQYVVTDSTQSFRVRLYASLKTFVNGTQIPVAASDRAIMNIQLGGFQMGPQADYSDWASFKVGTDTGLLLDAYADGYGMYDRISKSYITNTWGTPFQPSSVCAQLGDTGLDALDHFITKVGGKVSNATRNTFGYSDPVFPNGPVPANTSSIVDKIVIPSGDAAGTYLIEDVFYYDHPVWQCYENFGGNGARIMTNNFGVLTVVDMNSGGGVYKATHPDGLGLFPNKTGWNAPSPGSGTPTLEYECWWLEENAGAVDFVRRKHSDWLDRTNGEQRQLDQGETLGLSADSVMHITGSKIYKTGEVIDLPDDWTKEL